MLKKIIALAVMLALFGVLKYLKDKDASFMVRILTATGMGIVLGLIFKGSTEYVVVFGRIFTNLLQAFVFPLLIFSIIATISSLESRRQLQDLGGKTIGVLALHNLLGSVLALILGKLTNLGLNSTIQMETSESLSEVPSFADVVISFFPKNIVDSMMNNKVIPVVIFAIIIGVVILTYHKKDEIRPFIDFIEAGSKLMSTVIAKIVGLTPYAILSLIANQVGTLDLSFVKDLLFLLVIVYIACLFHAFITTPAMVGLIGHVSPVKFIKKFFPIWLIAFSTQSSLGTMPANIKKQRDMGVPGQVAAFTSSIGTTFGMPGCASIWPITLAIFTINALGIDFSTGQYIIMVGTALLASLGTVGVPGTGTIQATALFASMGLPVEMILVLSPIAGVADMARTSTNVQASGSTGVIVASLQKVLDEDKYKA